MIVRCPYNPSHQMPESKLLFHISKGCQDKKQNGHLFEHCPYNYLHIVAKGEVDRHLVNCKSKLKNVDPNESKEHQILLQQAIAQQFQRSYHNPYVEEQINMNNSMIPGVNQDIKTAKKKRVRGKKQQEDPNLQQQSEKMPEWDDQFHQPVHSDQQYENILDYTGMGIVSDYQAEVYDDDSEIKEIQIIKDDEWSVVIDNSQNNQKKKKQIRNQVNETSEDHGRQNQRRKN